MQGPSTQHMPPPSRLDACYDHISTLYRFGGELLGPVRFDHIDICAREVCRTFRTKEEIEDHITTLASLDDILGTLRAELEELKQGTKDKSDAASCSVDAVPEHRHEDTRGKDKHPLGDSPTSSQTTAPSSTPGSSRAPNYTSLRQSQDLPKLKRLITARENSIRSVKAALKKLQQQHSTNE